MAISTLIGNPGAMALPSRHHRLQDCKLKTSTRKTDSDDSWLLGFPLGRISRFKGPTMYATNLEEPIGPQYGSIFLGPQGTSLKEPSRKQGTVAAYALHSVTWLPAVTVDRLETCNGNRASLSYRVTPTPAGAEIPSGPWV